MPVAQGSKDVGASSANPDDPTPADAAFEVCPLNPPEIGTSCDLAPHTGCAYYGFQGRCESFICVKDIWQSANGDGC
jgi:hypothetical protein